MSTTLDIRLGSNYCDAGMGVWIAWWSPSRSNSKVSATSVFVFVTLLYLHKYISFCSDKAIKAKTTAIKSDVENQKIKMWMSIKFSRRRPPGCKKQKKTSINWFLAILQHSLIPEPPETLHGTLKSAVQFNWNWTKQGRGHAQWGSIWWSTRGPSDQMTCDQMKFRRD